MGRMDSKSSRVCSNCETTGRKCSFLEREIASLKAKQDKEQQQNAADNNPTNYFDKIKALLADQEKEMNILKCDLVDRQREVEELRSKLEESEKLRLSFFAEKPLVSSTNTVGTDKVCRQNGKEVQTLQLSSLQGEVDFKASEIVQMKDEELKKVIFKANFNKVLPYRSRSKPYDRPCFKHPSPECSTQRMMLTALAEPGSVPSATENRKASTNLNCATIKMGRANETPHFSCAIPAKAAKSEFLLSRSKKKRKVIHDCLFGSDDELPSPTKKLCADDFVTLYCNDDDRMSIVSVKDCNPSILYLSSSGESSPAKNPTVVKSMLPLNGEVLSVEVAPSNAAIDPIVESKPKTATPDPCVETDGIKVVDDDREKVMLIPKVEGGVSDCETTDPDAQDGSRGITRDYTTLVHLSTKEVLPTETKYGPSQPGVILHSKEEIISSLLSSPNIKKEPILDPAFGSLPICAPPLPYLFPIKVEPVEDAAENERPAETSDPGSWSERALLRASGGGALAKLRGETDVWNQRVYVSLANRQAFGDLLKPLPVADNYSIKEIGALRDIVITYLNSTESPLVLQSIVKALGGYPDLNIVKEVMSQMHQDGSSLEPSDPPELRSTKRCRLLTSLIAGLHESKPHLTELMLRKIEKGLCHLCQKPAKELIVRLVSLHLGICLRLRLAERTRTFLYDVIYCFPGYQALNVAAHFLNVAPVALKHAFTAQDDFVALTIACTLMHSKGRAAKNHPVRNLVKNQYKYDGDHLPSPAQLIQRMVQSLTSGTFADGPGSVEACLVLLSKQMGWKWAHQAVVQPMQQLVERWMHDDVPLSAAAVALRVVAFVMRTVPGGSLQLVDTLFEWLVTLLLKRGMSLIHEPVLEALMMFGREKHFPTVCQLLQDHSEIASKYFAISAAAYISNFGRVNRTKEKKSNKAKAIAGKCKLKFEAIEQSSIEHRAIGNRVRGK